MTIDEAIKQLTENYDFWMQFACDDVLEEGEHKVNNCEENANYCYQLIQWLEELKGYQEQHIRMCEYHEVATVEHIYNKAIDDFKAECHKQISKNHEKYGFNQRDLVNLDLAEIDMIAEQLKGGGKNE